MGETTANELLIREATREDYPAVAAVLSATWPDIPTTVETLEDDDRDRDPRCKHAMLVGEVGGRIVGVATYDQHPGMYHPRKFSAEVRVHPDFEKRGFGRALADELDRRLSVFDPISVLGTAREDHARGLAFLARRGYAGGLRYFESRLNVSAFDFVPFAHVLPEVEARGFEIKTLADFPDDGAHRRKLYELFSDVRRDVPRPEPATPIDPGQFETWVFDSPFFLREAHFVAVDGRAGEWAGTSALWKGDGDYLDTGLTGVRRAHRGQRLALAMKLRAIQYARDVGSPEIRTDNESRNRPMLAINDRLGFARQPAWVEMVRTWPGAANNSSRELHESRP